MDMMVIAWVKKYVAKSIVGAGGGIIPQVVSELPEVGEAGLLYLLERQGTAAKATTPTYNYYDEYLYVGEKWEQIGSTEIPFDEYVTFDELSQAIKDEVDALIESGALKGEKGDKGDRGEDGKSAYEIWLDQGNTGTEGDFIGSLKGEKGDVGDVGPQGERGEVGPQGERGETGLQGERGERGEKGEAGADGESAYQTWISLGNEGDEAAFIESLRGEIGPRGEKGESGEPFAIAKTYESVAAMEAAYPNDGLAIGSFVIIDTGDVENVDNAKLYYKGESAYIYVVDMSGAAGEDGAAGIAGEDGKSAYQIWLDQGNVGTQDDFIAAMKGEKGDRGEKGEDGAKGDTGERGEKGDKGEDGATPVKGVDYFTEDDKSELVNEVIAALPIYDGSVIVEE